MLVTTTKWQRQGEMEEYLSTNYNFKNYVLKKTTKTTKPNKNKNKTKTKTNKNKNNNKNPLKHVCTSYESTNS